MNWLTINQNPDTPDPGIFVALHLFPSPLTILMEQEHPGTVAALEAQILAEMNASRRIDPPGKGRTR